MNIRMLQLMVLILFSAVHAQEAADAPITPSHEEIKDHRLTKIKPLRMKSRSSVSEGSLVHVVVNTSGEVTAASVRADCCLHSLPPELVPQAIEQVSRLRYRPFEMDGRLVRAEFDDYVRVLPRERIPLVHVPFPEILDRRSVRITLHRTRGFAMGPYYEVEITGDGTVTYTGREIVAVRGRHVTHIPPERVDELLALFRKADYFSLDREYQSRITDNPTKKTSITIGAQTMSVVDYIGETVGMPEIVHEIEDAIDRVAGTEKWIRSNGDTIPALRKEGVDFHSDDGGRLLLFAAQNAPEAAVRELIISGAPVDWRDDWGSSPLFGAACRKLEEGAAVISLLVSAGAKVNATDQQGDSALHFASNGNAAQAIINAGADVNARNRGGRTPLMNTPSDEVTRLLIRAGADLTARDNDGRTALECSEWNPSKKKILERYMAH